MIIETLPGIIETLPDIPRALTGLAEWLACLVYILLRTRRLPRGRFVLLAVVALGVQVGMQEFAAVLPLRLWTVGMALAVATMFGFIVWATTGSARDAGLLRSVWTAAAR